MAAGTVVALKVVTIPLRYSSELLLDFLDNGTSALDRYDGHFAMAIYNGRESSLSIISDPLGIFAIYYARLGRRYSFLVRLWQLPDR